MARAVICGNCGQPVDVADDATPDAVLQCPSCGRDFRADGGLSAAPAVIELLAPTDAGCVIPSDLAGPDPIGPAWEVPPALLAAVVPGEKPGEPGQKPAGDEENPAETLGSTFCGACDFVAPAPAEQPGSAVLPADMLSGETAVVAAKTPAVLTGAQMEPEVSADSGVSPDFVVSMVAEPVPVAVSQECAEPPGPSTEMDGGDQAAEVAHPSLPEIAILPTGDPSTVPVAGEPGLGVEVAPEVVGESAMDMDSGAGTDGASLAHALGDLWQEAGVAPPLEMPSGGRAAGPAEQGRAAASDSITGGAQTVAPHAYAVAPPRSVGSFAARARAQERVSPRKVVRAVGMVISGLLAIGLTYGVFRLFGWGSRPRPPRPAASQKAEGVQPQAPRPGKDPFVPDWKGLKPLDKR